MVDSHVRLAVPSDRDELSRLRVALWPESSVEEHRKELASILAGESIGSLPMAVFVAEEDGSLAGFLEVGLRSHADGCDPRSPAGYVEGWFVSEIHRRKGVGARLLAAAEDWARTQGCVEMASDAVLDNVTSQRVHEAVGFEIVDRCVRFRKTL